MKIVGIDPGKKGGIAIFDDENLSVVPMPVIKDGGLNLPEIASLIVGSELVVMEKATSMPGQGVTSMFTFGCGYGAIQGICAALSIRLNIVTPQAWKKDVLAGTAKDKAAAIEYCTRTYPLIRLIPPGCRKPSDGMADAICILNYGVMKFGFSSGQIDILS